MARSQRDRYNTARARLLDADIDQNSLDRITEFLDAKDPKNIVVDDDGDTKKPSTLTTYCNKLKLIATRIDKPLTECTASDFNRHFQSLVDGTHEDVDDDGVTIRTVSVYQASVRKFLAYHDDLGVDPEDVPLQKDRSSGVDEQDVFTREEIEAMRKVIDNPRDRCLFELLVNTGQRVSAVSTLRRKDIDLDRGSTGAYRHNPEADALKGANEVGTWRPLLGAKAAVRQWLNYHPSDDPEAYLITHLPSWGRGSGKDQLRGHTINRIVQGIAEEAGVDKPANVHNFRHTFTTICKRDYDLDNDTIKWLLGHTADSTVMETTYSHLRDSDLRRKTEVAAGAREEDEESTLTPAICPTCDEPLSPTAKACPNCGEVFTPDAQSVKQQIQDDLFKDAVEATGEEAEAISELRSFLQENPNLVAELINETD